MDVFREFNLRAEAIPNTVDSSHFCYWSREPLFPRLVCTRGFHPYYSVDVVVRAFDLLKKTYPESGCVSLARGLLRNKFAL